MHYSTNNDRSSFHRGNSNKNTKTNKEKMAQSKKIYRRCRRDRDRKDDESYTDWLLSKQRQNENKVNLDGTNVYCPFISSKEFTLSTTNYNKGIFRLACIPESTSIRMTTTATSQQEGEGSNTTASQAKITIDDVWNVIMDFDNYSEWNPFQRHVRIMEEVEVEVDDEVGEDEPPSLSSQQDEDDSNYNNSNVIYEMDVVPFGKQVQEIFYVDEQRHIFIYGIPDRIGNGQRAKSARCQWLTIEKVKMKTLKNNSTNDEDCGRDDDDPFSDDGFDDDGKEEGEEEVIMYHSMDCFLYGWQMYVIWLVPMLYTTILHKFNQQHAALKERVISITMTNAQNKKSNEVDRS